MVPVQKDGKGRTGVPTERHAEGSRRVGLGGVTQTQADGYRLFSWLDAVV